MGRSRIGWALSVAAPWCVAFAVLVSITAEAEQEPLQFTSAFARSQLISASGGLDRAIIARPLRTVDEDGAPLPIVQARYAVGDPRDFVAQSDESEPNGALKSSRQAFPAVDRSAKSDPGFNVRRNSTVGEGRPSPMRTSPGRTSLKIRTTTNSIRAIR